MRIMYRWYESGQWLYRVLINLLNALMNCFQTAFELKQTLIMLCVLLGQYLTPTFTLKTS